MSDPSGNEGYAKCSQEYKNSREMVRFAVENARSADSRFRTHNQDCASTRAV